ncbi:hypothetical protein, partial [Chitinophaga sp. 22308]|uniref:hypothetical protein n=1 Tax=Chitinophaga sp. 22308 TaxID=3453906 RepID=UPI003F8791F1
MCNYFLKNFEKIFCVFGPFPIFAIPTKTPHGKTNTPKAPTVGKFLKVLCFKTPAEVAHLVEHDLAKVGVAGSSPV